MDILCSVARPDYLVMNNKVLFIFSISGSMKMKLHADVFPFHLYDRRHTKVLSPKREEDTGQPLELFLRLSKKRKSHLNHCIHLWGIADTFFIILSLLQRSTVTESDSLMSLICNNTVDLDLENGYAWLHSGEFNVSASVLAVGGNWTKKTEKPIEIQGLKRGLNPRTLNCVIKSVCEWWNN